MRLSGIVSSGLGRASIFMAQPHYQEQFLEILNEEAAASNVKVVESDLSKFYCNERKSGIDTLGISDT